MLARKSDIARALGVNRATVTRAAQAGRLVLAGDDPRFYDLDASLARYHATQGSRLDVQERHAATRAHHGTQNATMGARSQQEAASAVTRHPTIPTDPETPLAPARRPLRPSAAASAAPRDTLGSGLDRTALAAARLAAENAITKMDLGLIKGSRLLLADVATASQDLGARLSDHLHRVVDQCAARLAAATDPADQARLLHRELHQVARAFDRGGIDSQRRLRAAGRQRRHAQRGEPS